MPTTAKTNYLINRLSTFSFEILGNKVYSAFYSRHSPISMLGWIPPSALDYMHDYTFNPIVSGGGGNRVSETSGGRTD